MFLPVGYHSCLADVLSISPSSERTLNQLCLRTLRLVKCCFFLIGKKVGTVYVWVLLPRRQLLPGYSDLLLRWTLVLSGLAPNM